MNQPNISIENSQGVLVTSGHIDTQGGDVIVGGQKVTNIYQNADYSDLVTQIKDYEELLQDTKDPEKSMRYSQKVNDLKKRKKDFEDQVIQMAETFQQLSEGASERLKQAQDYFTRGDFKGANALLDAQELGEEQDRLLSTLERTEEKLRNSAHEFLVKAQATALDYSNPKRYEECCTFFERSLKSSRLFENLQAYGLFLASHNQLEKSITLLKECLPMLEDKQRQFQLEQTLGMLCLQKQDFIESEKHYRRALEIQQEVDWEDDDLRELKKADTILNLGFLFNTVNRDNEAKELFDESLNIREELSHKNPEKYAVSVAPALSHRGLLYYEHKMFEEAQQDFETAIKLLDDYTEAHAADYQNESVDEKASRTGSMALLWHNLALVYMVTKPEEAEAYSMKAIEILEPLVKQNPFTYEPTHAFILNGLGMFYLNQGEFEKAKAPLEQSMEIYERLASLDPQAFEAHYAMFLNNMAIWYTKTEDFVRSQPILEKSIEIYRRKSAETPDAFNATLALTLQNLGEAKYFAHEQEEGVKLIKEAQKLYESLIQTQPEATSAAYVLCCSTLGYLQLEMGGGMNSLENWKTALVTASKNVRENPTVYFPLLNLVVGMIGGYMENCEDLELKEAFWWLILEESSSLQDVQDFGETLGLVASELEDIYDEKLEAIEDKGKKNEIQKKQAKLEKWLEQYQISPE